METMETYVRADGVEMVRAGARRPRQGTVYYVAIVSDDPWCIYAVGKTDRGALIDAHRQGIHPEDPDEGYKYQDISVRAFKEIKKYGWSEKTYTDQRGGVVELISEVHADLLSAAAAAMGSIKSDRKAASSRENGKNGGRPRKAKP